MRCTKSAPDLSSLSERVSEIVSTAIFSGTNCLVSSSPGIGTPLLTPTLGPGAVPCQAARASLSPCGRGQTLQRGRRQRIAAIHLAAIEAVGEPALALFRGAVGEGVGHHIALRLLLQPVVADRGRGLQGLVDVAGVEEAVLGLG